MTMQSANKAFFFDIDGTLVDDRTKVIPDSTMEALAEAERRGYMTFICSGRAFCCVREVSDRLPLSGIICSGGTHVLYHGNTLMEHRVSLERGNEIKALIKKYGIDAVFEATQATYFSGHPFLSRKMDQMTTHMEKISEVIYDAVDDPAFTYNKVCICNNEDPEYMKGYDIVLKDLERDMLCTFRKGNFHECIPYGYTKGTAMDFILKRFGISYEDAYVFGDSVNDISLFKSPAKYRIAMKEHDPELDGYATYVTDRVLDDGLYKAMKHLGVI